VYFNRRTLTLSLLFILFIMPLSAQSKEDQKFQRLALEHCTVKSWDIFSGLPSDSITSLYQDAEHYLWIGTFDGLLRFDGAEFKTFDETNTPGFSAHSAHTFIEDADGTLWIGTENEGLARYRNGTFTTFTIDDGLLSNSIRALAIDPEGSLWIGTNQGLMYYSNGSFEEPVYQTSNPFKGRQVNALLYDESNGLIAARSNGGLFLHADENPEPVIELAGERISASATTADNIPVVGTRSGRVFLLHAEGPVEKSELFIRGNQVRSMHAGGKSGALWIAGNNGLFCLDADNTLSHLPAEAHSVLQFLPKAVLEDHEGNLWVGTRSGGLHGFYPSRFTNYGKNFGPTGRTVNAAAEYPEGTYWIAADDGLYCLREGNWIENQLTETLAGVRVKHLQAGKNALYVSTISDHGVVVYTGKEIRYINSDSGLPSTVIKKTILDDGGNLWISSSGGVIKYEKPGEMTIYNRDTGFISDEIYDLFEDSRGRIWIATVEDGLVRFEHNGAYTRFTAAEGLSGEMVFSVYEDHKDRFWISTASGTFLMDQNDTLHPVGYAEGLPYLYVYNAVPLEDKLWFTSVRGLSSAALEEVADTALGKKEGFTVRHYGIEDGLLASPNALSWPYIDSTKRIWIPTHRGISVFDQTNPVHSPKDISVLFETVEIDGTTIQDPRSLPKAAKGIDKITVHFTGITFAHAHRTSFSYTLEGYDDRWYGPGPDRTAVYTKLPPGNYRFRLRAYVDEQIRGAGALTVTVKPVFHQRALFRIGLIILFAAVVTAVVMLQFARMGKKNRRLENILSGVYGNAVNRKKTNNTDDEEQKLMSIKQNYGLTDREIQVLRMVIAGKRDKEIAYSLDRAVSTVSNTVGRIYRKTGTGSRVELLTIVKS
jgi:ligand-binding sensor domain-containing protein/DNA-binding CsgD family transcriptional regulator